MSIYENPAALLQKLIQFDTSNGNEAPLIQYVDGLLKDAGFETVLLAPKPERPSVITRLKGRGEAPPLLLYGHVDVVPISGQVWDVPPFSGAIQDGYVWGRGALDMKGPDVMLLTALLRAKAEGLDLPGDVIFALMPDEESGGVDGAQFLVREHAALFEGVRYALSEFGGFSMDIAGQRFYPIQVAQKRVCTVRVTVRGEGGHGSTRHTGGTMAKLGRILTALDQSRLPVRLLPFMVQMIQTIAAQLDEPTRSHILALTDAARTDATLDALGAQGRIFDPLTHNTANATIVQGGSATNVIPSEILLTLDGRVLPGVTTAAFFDEIRAVIGDDGELSAVTDEPVVLDDPDMTHFDALGAVLRALDPTAVPIPYMTSGATDARYFAHLGIQTYGFVPMRLPQDFAFGALMHNANERIPIETLEFGCEAVYRALGAIFQLNKE